MADSGKRPAESSGSSGPTRGAEAPAFFAGVRKVAEILDNTYTPSDLGNKKDPLNELAYIILSGQTGEGLYQQVYRSFKRHFRRWDQVADASEEEIAEVILLGGLARQKARYLKAIACRLRSDFGSVTLRRLKTMSTLEAERYLCSLPGVGIKTARCVLMYCLNRPVFPADIHCLRVMTRLDWINWTGQRAETFAETSQNGVPPDLRQMLHIRLVQHGRQVCRSKPLCEACVLNESCPSSRTKQRAQSKEDMTD